MFYYFPGIIVYNNHFLSSNCIVPLKFKLRGTRRNDLTFINSTRHLKRIKIIILVF